MRHTSLDIFEQTMFRTSHIAVSHQRHAVTVDVDDTVYDVSIAIAFRRLHRPAPPVKIALCLLELLFHFNQR